MTTQEQLAKTERLLFESIPAVADSLIASTCVRYTSPARQQVPEPNKASGGTPSEPLPCAKAQQTFLDALRAYAEMLVVEAVSRYDVYEGAFFTRDFFEELEKAIEDDEVIPMEEVAAEVGLKW